MASITQNISLEVGIRSSYKYLYAKQGDDGSRYVCVTILNSGVKVIPEDGSTAFIRALKPDGHSCYNAAVINSDGTITAELTDQMLAVKGIVDVDICLTGANGSVLSTVSFKIDVERAPVGDGVTSSNEFLQLKQIVDEGNALLGDYSTALNQLESIRDDAQRAKTGAENAKKGAVAAEKTAVTAKDDALSAKNAAESSEANAEQSAKEANDALTNANKAAQNAADSAAGAAQSLVQTNAAKSVTEQLKNQAEVYANQAAGYAGAATVSIGYDTDGRITLFDNSEEE